MAADEPDNMVLAQLREMRAENAAFRDEMAAFREETSTRLDTLTHFVHLMGSYQYRMDERLTALEERSDTPSPTDAA